ncbi:MAG: Dps family protein [Bacteroidota bacterium]
MKIENLNKLLSDLMVLYQKQRNYHWNMQGHGFMVIHEFLEKEYDAFADHIDELAEIIRMKNSFPVSTFKEFLDHTQLKEGDLKLSKDEMLKDIKSDYETILAYIKSQESDDNNIDDFFVAMTKHLEKSIWLMNSEVI